MVNRAVRVAARVGTGIGAVAVAAVLVAAAVAVPTADLASAGQRSGLDVTPQAVDQQRSCPGPLLRLGDLNGQNATSVTSFGTAGLTASSGAVASPLADLDVIAADGGGASQLITAPAAPEGGAPLAAVQAQNADEPDQAGLAVASCEESSAVAWVVAGATDTGRTSLLLLANPSRVESSVDVSLFGVEGPIDAPGLTGLSVPANSQRVLSLAGFAPSASALTARVESRGGLIVPTLQQSTVRGLEPGGVELTGATQEPADIQVIPGVRVTTAAAAAERSQIAGSTDVATAVRVLVPGSEDADVTIGASSDTPGVPGVTVEAKARAGAVVDIPVDGLGDGTYTVTVQASAPIVASVRAATVAAPDPNAVAADQEDFSFEVLGDAADVTAIAGQRIDFAWFVAAPVLGDVASFAVASEPSPRLTVTSVAGTPADLVLTDEQGGRSELALAAGSTASVDLRAGGVYRLEGAAGVSASVSYAADGRLAAAAVRPANPLAGVITVYR